MSVIRKQYTVKKNIYYLFNGIMSLDESLERLVHYYEREEIL